METIHTASKHAVLHSLDCIGLQTLLLNTHVQDMRMMSMVTYTMLFSPIWFIWQHILLGIFKRHTKVMDMVTYPILVVTYPILVVDMVT